MTSDVLAAVIARGFATPDHAAVKDLERDLSYVALVADVAECASGLAGRGVAEGDRVALHLPNSVDFVVLALACLWRGAVFVPLSVSDPDDRLTKILGDCSPSIVISHREGGVVREALATSSVATIDELRAGALDSVPVIEPAPRAAYMIYTSGTTGTPKGVVIDTTALGAALRATCEALGLDERTRTLCVSPFHFDGSFGTLFPTLLVGGSVVMRPRDALLYPRTFFDAVRDEAITYTGFSPSYLKLLLASPRSRQLGDSTLEVIALGGEASSAADVRALWALAPSTRVFNRYGPTETTIAVTHLHLTPATVTDETVPIGVPHHEVTFDLVDENGAVVDDDDVVGELYIGGAQLMSGYWRAPEQTRSVLRRDVVAGGLVYRTGDLVYRNKQGLYVYVDRADRVIKRSGVRISLIEVSAAMRALEHVTAAAALTFDNADELGIVVFVVTDGFSDPVQLLRAARERLPESMLPNRVEIVTELPLNRSSKLDERRLLAGAGLTPRKTAPTPTPRS